MPTDPHSDHRLDVESPDLDEWEADTARAILERLAHRAARDCCMFESPAQLPAPDLAMRYLRTGVGPVVALYIHARTGGRFIHFSAEESTTLEAIMNDWLRLYAACYGVDLTGTFSIRTAAELLVDTHNIQDVAQLLTGVPPRSA